MTAPDWPALIERVIGAPFMWGGRGPEAFDCWGLVRWALAELNEPCPLDWTYPARGYALVSEIVSRQTQLAHWQRLDEPVPGAVLALSKTRRIHHVALWTPFGALHTEPATGARISTLARLRSDGFRRLEVYRYVGDIGWD